MMSLVGGVPLHAILITIYKDACIQIFLHPHVYNIYLFCFSSLNLFILVKSLNQLLKLDN